MKNTAQNQWQLFFHKGHKFWIVGTLILSLVACGGDQLDAEVREKIVQMQNQIKKDFPGNELPKYSGFEDQVLNDILSVTEDNYVVIDNQQEIMLTGISCKTDELNKYLNAVLLNEKSHLKLAVEYTGFNTAERRHAYVWLVNFYVDQLRANTAFNLNEALMTTGFCIALAHEKHLYHERYERLWDVGQVLKRYRHNIR